MRGSLLRAARRGRQSHLALRARRLRRPRHHDTAVEDHDHTHFVGQTLDARKKLQQRLHDQLNALCPGLSAPSCQGRALKISSPTGQAVLACAA
ncbi:MAG: hypothetical protein ACXVHQ_40395, partial [Solirubrobacteraceae bacterium]